MSPRTLMSHLNSTSNDYYIIRGNNMSSTINTENMNTSSSMANTTNTTGTANAPIAPVYDKATLFKYLGWSFGIAWAMQLFIGYANHLYLQSGVMDARIIVAQVLMTVMMFVPLVSLILIRQKIGHMGWIPKLKGKVGYLLMAWFLPGILTALGAAIYFLIFPSHFDITGQAVVATAGEEALAQLEAQGLTFKMYIMICCIQVFTVAPILNILPSVGEEAGWRGYMYPALKELYGKKTALILGGVIWGIWHWPLMILTGYEYGTEYRGFPTAGWVVFAIFTVAAGILCNYVYEKSGCIWLPAIFHGALNAAATVPVALVTADSAGFRVLGPAPNGLISAVPLIIAAAVIFIKTTISDKDKQS